MVTYQTLTSNLYSRGQETWICVSSSLCSVVTLLPWQLGAWSLVRRPLGKYWGDVQNVLNRWKPQNISPLRNLALHSFSVLLSDCSFRTNAADVLCFDSLRLKVVWKYPRSKSLAFLQCLGHPKAVGISLMPELVFIQWWVNMWPHYRLCVHFFHSYACKWVSVWGQLTDVSFVFFNWFCTSFFFIPDRLTYLVFCGVFYVVISNFDDWSSRQCYIEGKHRWCFCQICTNYLW